jgi:CheY-like chemotaxis protein
MSRILYIDDEPDIREVAQMSLELAAGFDVRTAASGEEGLREAAAWQPDLILLDVMMPGMDGPTVLKKLQENPQTAAIPVVFITARTQAQEVAALESLGARGVIAKPFDPMGLGDQAHAYLRQG